MEHFAFLRRRSETFCSSFKEAKHILRKNQNKIIQIHRCEILSLCKDHSKMKATEESMLVCGGRQLAKRFCIDIRIFFSIITDYCFLFEFFFISNFYFTLFYFCNQLGVASSMCVAVKRRKNTSIFP